MKEPFDYVKIGDVVANAHGSLLIVTGIDTDRDYIMFGGNGQHHLCDYSRAGSNELFKDEPYIKLRMLGL